MFDILKKKASIFKISLILAIILAISVANSLADTNDNEETSVSLLWTAPGDDGNLGTALEYDVRYSTSYITLH